MEVKDIIKEDRNKIVPSYEYRDYYRKDGSYLYNSNREANWYKLGILDCFDYFEQNRLKACDNQTPQEAWREAEFVVPFVKEHHRTPTFSDAIEVTRKQMIDKACKIYCDDLCERSRCGMCYHKYDHKAQVKNDFKYSECETLKMFRKDMEE